MINDPIAKVRNTVAWVFYKIAEHVPSLIFSTTEILNLFMTNCIARLQDHHRISMLVYSTVKTVYEKAYLNGVASYLNQYFFPIISDAMQAMYKPDIVQHNLSGVLSAYINDIVERCDAEGLNECLLSLLNLVLTELSSMAQNPNHNNIPPEQSENYINYFSGLA